ncbi:IS607 family transposase [Hydrogenibacillus schlegelii]|uniref:Transposase n=1 Tax=Hydrogenibacillus schlegelii TaxID=1484 RepID=A0A132MH34_HYDSH|nr:IS607 family transposase [Hydrogenibacillus schlegelii]KWW96731.1 transposase [Hydrogenibacillus schlegelii]OAR04868.1 transposase [Hydrogenibacillus schlegelii]
MKLYSIGEFARLLGVSVSTLRNWDKEGRLKPLRTPTGKRRYTEEMLFQALGMKRAERPKKTVLYARVSSAGQKNDLETQTEFLRQFAVSRGYGVDEVIADIGSALNDRRKGFMRLVSMVLRGEVERVVIADKDRLVRFGFEFFEDLFAKYGAEIVVVHRDEKAAPAQELAEDLVRIVRHFAARLYGSRSYRARKLVRTVREALGDEANRSAEESSAEPKKAGNPKADD